VLHKPKFEVHVELSWAASVCNEYLPATQSVQAAELVCAVNAENLPAAQSEHASKDTVALYVPAAHETQLCASGPVKPAGHVHCELPAGEIVPAGQVRQNSCVYPSK
jgi:hypothetical protein